LIIFIITIFLTTITRVFSFDNYLLLFILLHRLIIYHIVILYKYIEKGLFRIPWPILELNTNLGLLSKLYYKI
jgi:hypothetical protein